MGKNVYYDSDLIQLAISQAKTLRITDEDDLLYFIRTRTGYDLTKDGLHYHKNKFNKEANPNYTTFLEKFAQNQVLDTAETHLEILRDIRNDFYFIYSKKAKALKEKLTEGVEPDPTELTELIDVKTSVESTLDHIDKRELALLYIVPVKITMDKVSNKPKLDKADPDTRTAIHVAELDAETTEDLEKNLVNYTEVHGEDNLTA
jgi:hypothetical protein